MVAVKELELKQSEPVWDVARLFPTQGNWSVEEYLALDTNHLVEFSHGTVEVLDMPSELHQDITFLLAQLLKTYATARKLGKVLMAPFPILLWSGKFREPDVSFMLASHTGRRLHNHWIGADLVMEVLSSNRELDLVTKRREYAQASIPEYWIVDPTRRTITVLTLEGQDYIVHGEFGKGEQATSLLLPRFQIDVAILFEPASV